MFLARLVGVPAVLFLLVLLWSVVSRSFQEARDHAEASAMNVARTQAALLDRALVGAMHVAETHARLIESGAFTDETALRHYLVDALKSSPSVHCMRIGFEPGAFIASEQQWRITARWSEGKAETEVQRGPEVEREAAPWYQLPMRLAAPVWIEPSRQSARGETAVATFAVPVRKPALSANKPEVSGVASAEVDLEKLTRGLRETVIARTGYMMLFSAEGRLLAYPGNTRPAQLAPELIAAFQPGKEGFVQSPEPLQQRASRIAFTPVQTAGYTLAVVYPAEEVFGEANALWRGLLAATLAGGGALFLGLWLASRSVSRPIADLTHAARSIVAGDVSGELQVRSGIGEIRDLAAAFHDLVHHWKARMEELRHTIALKQRMEGELGAARRIQMSMLPREWRDRSDWPEHAALDLHAIIQPAREVGGDLYDYRFLNDHRLAILVGDVSGKGVPAALFMAMTQTLFQAHASLEHAVSQTIARMNAALCEEAHTGMFVTLIYAQLDVRTGLLEVCNAGHTPPYRISTEHVEPLHCQRNPALGLVPECDFSTALFQLNPGERLFFYTDGVTEAMNSLSELYSVQRLELVLRETRELTVESLAKAVILDVQNHRRAYDASDDITVLAFDYSGPSHENSTSATAPPVT
ncbi:MAG: SpoIIE family protein phosphatase [Roseimicrobium sp.]